jgi:hypothetical protein
MVDLINDYIEPTRLTGMIRTALGDLQINQHKLARWLPNVNLDDVVYKYNKGQQGLPEAAVYRAYDAESRIGRREGISEVMGSLPPISEKMVLNEYERLRLRKLNDDALLPFIARDARRLALNIGARLELARGDAIFNGQVTLGGIDGEDVKQTVSFGRSGSHAVTASTLWSDHDDSTPIDDLMSWAQTYTDDTGEEPGVILMPKAVFFHLQQNAQIKGRTWPSAATTDASLPTASVQQVNDTLAGMGLPRIELYDAKVKVEGVATRITPATKIALLPTPGNPVGNAATDLGATYLGTTAESLEPEYGLAGQEAGVVAAQWKTKDPVRVWTHAAAIALPVLATPDLTFVATVAA